MTTKLEKQIVSDWNNNVDTNITSYFKSIGLSGEAEHVGSMQFYPTSMWKIYNPKKSLAKTDIKIGDYKISLKSMNDHIVMAAKKNEAIATTMCVAESLYGKRIPNIINDVVQEMNGMITKAVSPVRITMAKKIGDPVIKEAESKHREILNKIEDMFDDPVFQTSFIQEVLSGKIKFGKNSDGSATHILYVTHKPIMHNLNDLSYISTVTGNVDIRIDFKTTQKVQGPEMGKYRYWSVLQMISKELIKDSVIYEDNLLSKSLSYVLSILSDIRSSITSWKDLFAFLDVEPTIILKIK